jgi:hypothetical protein
VVLIAQLAALVLAVERQDPAVEEARPLERPAGSHDT